MGFLDNISRHLMVEQSVLDAWSAKDDRRQETIGNESAMPLGTVANTLESGSSSKEIILTKSGKSSLKLDAKLKAKEKQAKPESTVEGQK